MEERGWKAFEAEMNSLLGLRSTISSGNKFFDPGDGVTPGPGGLYVECKYTQSLGYRVVLKEALGWRDNAVLLGKRLLVMLRFWPIGNRLPSDWVLLSLHDFLELTGREA